jgi:hypothetical protein
MSECHATNLNRRLPAFDHMTAVALAEMDLALADPAAHSGNWPMWPPTDLELQTR